MRLYETTFIANQELTKKQIDMLADSFEDLLKSKNSKIVRKEYWGVRTFAYPIKKKWRQNTAPLIFHKDSRTFRVIRD